MIYSMTGYGRGAASYENKQITVEIKSLNSKFLDLNVRMPALYKSKEIGFRNLCTKALKRGKVDVSITVENDQIENKFSINQDIVGTYFDQLNPIAETLQQNKAELLQAILRLPEVISATKEELSDQEWQTVESAFQIANENFIKFRKQEGDALLKDFSNRVDNIESRLAQVEKLFPERIDQVRERIKAQLDQLTNQAALDPSRLEQEMIYYIEKLDINEEIVRLGTHCAYYKHVMLDANQVQKGKKLGFINQEIGREINTMGSKIQDANIQKLVVEMKDELEKMKEQVLNIV